MSNGFDPDQDRGSFSPDLGPNCLQRFSAKDKSCCKQGKSYTHADVSNSPKVKLLVRVSTWEHQRLWRASAIAQAHQSLNCSTILYVPKSHGLRLICLYDCPFILLTVSIPGYFTHECHNTIPRNFSFVLSVTWWLDDRLYRKNVSLVTCYDQSLDG